MKHLIIGNGIAGINAAETIRRLAPDAAITIVSDEPQPVYSRCLIPHLIDGSKSETDLFIRPGDFYENLNLITKFGVKVTRINPHHRQVELADGETLPYDRLLLATGAAPALPDVPGAHLPGVLGLRTMADAQALAQRAAKAKKAVVIGAGLVSLKGAAALLSLGLEVTVFAASRQILSQLCDEQAAALLQKALANTGLKFRLGQDVQAITGDSSVQGIVLNNGEELPADLVLIGKGVTPNTSLLKEAGLEVNWGVKVNEFMQTVDPDIFAAGDVAETWDVVRRTQRTNTLWPNAAQQGRVAGSNMAGFQRPYRGSIAMNSITLAGIPMITAGITRPEGHEYRTEVDFRPQQNHYHKVVYRGRQPVGLIAVGEIQKAGILVNKILNQLS
ncbi:MAG: FAD-dependent oxidoreductase [Clostridia bacterium]|nr:FAD-dependent oxidoreductase [Clostridia bacterium]